MNESINTPQDLTPDYQEKVLAKWGELLEAGPSIANEKVKMATALVLENTEKDFNKKMLKEAYNGSAQTMGSYGGMGAGAGTNLSPNGGGALGATFNYGQADSRVPNVVIPTLRRIFPELVAHNIVGVQAMNGPVSFAYAIRHRYGVNSAGGVGASEQGDEMGYNTIHSHFTGASGLLENDDSANYPSNTGGVGTVSSASTYWTAFAGTHSSSVNGQGAALNPSEWWAIGEDMPMTEMKVEKGIVEAKARKLAAHWSLELEEEDRKSVV